MSEHQWKILISAYADGELSTEDIVKAERVLEDEPEAREYLAQVRRMSTLLRVVNDAPTSPDMDRKVLKPVAKGGRMANKFNWKAGVLTLCTLVIVGTAAFHIHFQRGLQGRLKSASDNIGDQYTRVPSFSKQAVKGLALTQALSGAPTQQYEPYYASTSLQKEKQSAEGIAATNYKDASIEARYSDKMAAGSVAQFAGVQLLSMESNQFIQNAPGNTEEYNTIEESRFLETARNPLSTFSADVDTASYTNIRRFLNSNQIPPKDAVRVEEMINYFGYDYPKPKGHIPFSITTQAAVCPWNTGHQLVLIGLKGKSPDVDQLPASNLTFLLDISGSMQSPDKLPLIQQAFTMMVRQLRDEDRVAIVVYASSEGVLLESTPGTDKEKIIAAINGLAAGGSTAGGSGIKKAYEIAEKNFIKDGNNRVILATDGDFNVGVSSTSEMVRLIEEEKNKGVFLTVIGVGSDGNLKDGRLMQIADKGNGSYHYFDSLQEAKKVFLTELGSTLFTIAKDVKIQVEFNPAAVKGYRLIGYEKRKLNKEDFNDDKKDAGELGAGHTVTALYEIIPVGSEEVVANVDALKYQKIEPVTASPNELLTVKLRYKEPQEDVSKLITRALSITDIKDQPTGDFAFAAAVAEFGMLLRNSEFKGTATLDQVLQSGKAAKGDDKFGYREEFIKLVEIAQTLGISGPGGNIKFK